MKKLLKVFLIRLKALLSFKKERWVYLFKSLSFKEKRLVFIFLLIATVASFSLTGYDYWILREPTPAKGGSYTEGIIGEPRYINPILTFANETEKDLVKLIFAGLTKHDSRGDIVGDLAQDIEIKEKGRVYEFTLRQNLKWPDGENLTADDVIFTIKLIQDSKYQSPIRDIWQGVRVERVNDQKVRFSLNLPYDPFLENTTIGILPQHFWENIKPQSFALAELNTKPVGAGPYKVKKIVKGIGGSIKALELEQNPYYHDRVYIKKIDLKFYTNEDDLLKAYKDRKIEAFSLLSPRFKKEVERKNNNVYSVNIPRYFAVFFNEENNGLLGQLKIKRALSYLTPRERIIREVLKEEATPQDGPLPLWIIGDSPKYSTFPLDKEKAKEILLSEDWKDLNNDGFLEKENGDEVVPLEFTLTTTDWPELTQTASILKEVWEEVGFRINLDIIPIGKIQPQVIQPREYEALLFGEVLAINPDPFSFWHSSQIKDPGLNLSLYENNRVDSLLESVRQTTDKEQKKEKFREIQKIITSEIPAIFLYNPYYIYVLPDKIKGFSKTIVSTPSHRFEDINNWFIKTKRTLK